MVLPPKVWGDFFQKMFSWETSISWAKIYGEVILNWRGNIKSCQDGESGGEFHK